MSKRVADAREAVRIAERELEAALCADYPPEKFIKWDLGGREYAGHVIRNGYGDRIEVRNADTNRARWISAASILSR